MVGQANIELFTNPGNIPNLIATIIKVPFHRTPLSTVTSQ